MLHAAFAVDGKGYVFNQTCHKCICQLRETIEIKLDAKYINRRTYIYN